MTEVPITKPPRRKRRRLWALIGVVLFLAAAGATLFAFPYAHGFVEDFRGVNQIVYWPGPPGSTTYIDPVNAWTLRFPNSWHAQRIRRIERGGIYTPESHGIFISNLPDVSDPLEEGVVPAELVAVRVAYAYYGGFKGTCDHDTPLPLGLDKAKPVETALRDDPGPPLKHLYRPFCVRDVALYSVRAWIGSQASKEDLAMLDQIVGSVRYESIPLPSGWSINVCMIDE